MRKSFSRGKSKKKTAMNSKKAPANPPVEYTALGVCMSSLELRACHMLHACIVNSTEIRQAATDVTTRASTFHAERNPHKSRSHESANPKKQQLKTTCEKAR